jgi:predicted Fe-Mo cluster-binding NifX family protein
MKTIALGTSKRSLEAPVEGLFGRSRFFILVDPDTLEWEALDNMKNLSSQSMVGVATARTLLQKNIQTVITGKCGSKAFEELKAAGVQVIFNAEGRVRQVLEKFLRGDFSPAVDPNVHEARTY